MARQTHNDLLDHEALREAVDVPYDNGASGLTATEVQGAIDELAAGAGSGTLDDLSNVDTTGKADGDLIYWDAGSSLWKVQAPPSGSVPSGSTLGDMLVWDGAAWAVLPIGTDTWVLTADSGATLGVEWAAGGGGGGGGDTTDRTHSEIRSECFFPASNGLLLGTEGGVLQVNNGGAGIAQFAGTAEAGHPGIIEIGIGTSSTGRVGLYSGNQLQLGTGQVTFGCVTNFTTISDSSNRYTMVMGMGDSSSTALPNECIYFRYVDNVNSGKWQGVCRTGGSESTLDTGVTAGTLQWRTFAWVLNSAGTSVEFFIDDSSVGTITTNIPLFTDIGLTPMAMFRSVGTASGRFFNIDAYWYVFDGF